VITPAAAQAVAASLGFEARSSIAVFTPDTRVVPGAVRWDLSRTLAALRSSLDLMPSPVPDRPGLMMRDPFRYSDAVLIVPPPLVHCLECFDGQQTDLDLRAALVKITGELDVSEITDSLVNVLSSSGFLEDETFAQLKEKRQREFAEAARREPVHAGSAYPDELEPLNETMRGYMAGVDGVAAGADGLLGVVAPHVSPFGGWRSYQAAYGAMGPAYRDRTFIVLGTSHYGEPERFGLTRKPYVTPLGESRTETALVDWLAQKGGASVRMEDYCHSVEHSIEFQVLFLQYLYGPDICVVPILCGPYAHSIYRGGAPEQDEDVHRFLDALSELETRERARLFWVLGIDMAHMGRRYGDPFAATADQGEMEEVAAKDRARIDRLSAGDAAGFWELVQQDQDALKWCGSAPLYTFLKAVPAARGTLNRYEQWNIDDKSVVTFAGISFHRAEAQ
jgi:AmmeMemoRadiSam system protein B